jgi:hypothetical protein
VAAVVAANPAGSGLRVYRPRHPERTAFYKLFEKHFDRYLYSYDERFEPRFGPPAFPDRRQHVVRYYGAYASRSRGAGRFGAPRPPTEKRSRQEDQPQTLSPEQKRSRASWARLLRRILEVDPLLCSRCGVEMTIVSVITDPPVVDQILRHIAAGGGSDPFEARAPPPP